MGSGWEKVNSQQGEDIIVCAFEKKRGKQKGKLVETR